MIVLIVHVLQVFEQFSTVGCEGICDLDLSFGALAAYPWEIAASVAIAVILAVVLRLRGKSAYWAPLVGVVLVVSSASLTSSIFQAGLAPMYERNARIERGEIPSTPPLPNPVGSWGTGAEGAPFLSFAADGTLSGYDGCNEVSGGWTQDADGNITFGALSITAEVCDGVDTWLSKARSATIIDDFLYLNGAAGSPIGGLPPSP